uniref:Uncharacterized protein n=1 Tax=viral metagenome TaxID=1070528 RepID=A0A6C0EK41_9ZZZZ
MPSGRNWLVFVYVNLAFFILITSVYVLLSINNVMNNWAEYRCDALLMPFAGLIMQPTLPPGTTPSQYTQQNFQYCTNNMMSNSMGDFLQPLEYNNQLASINATSMTNSLNSARQNSSNVRNSLSGITTSLGNVFTNASANSKTITGYGTSLSGKTQVLGTASNSAISSNVSAFRSMPQT